MGQAVKISDTEMEALRDAARVSSRSISGQAEHWIRVGRAVERDPMLSYSRIELALRGLEPVALDTLGEAEQDDLLDRMGTAPATAEEAAFWRHRQRHGLGVGMKDDEGDDELVHAARTATPPPAAG
jgi:hypothetical protein